VYVLSPVTGHVTFGDGVHGAIPPKGAVPTASYRSVHRGVFDFIDAMKAVDPSISVCTSWGTIGFIEQVQRPYECFSIHSYTNFQGEHTDDWSGALEGHDRAMLGIGNEQGYVEGMTSRLPAQTDVAMSEFGMLWGDTEAYPHWMDSMTSALYMSSQWVAWLQMGVDWGTGNDLVIFGLRGLLSASPEFRASATAVARAAIGPMFDAGGRQVAATITGNPTRDPGLGAGTYSALAMASTRGPHGHLYLLVVNRLPFREVATTVHLSGFTGSGRMFVRAVTSPSFQSTTEFGDVALHLSQRGIGRTGFTYSFPPHSVTLLNLPPAHSSGPGR
jgi:alpha-N-arabinofuranosidase